MTVQNPRDLKKNVGLIDRIFRFLLGCSLVWIGLLELGGTEGSFGGILVALCSLLPFYMAVTRSCFVFRWFNVHSCSAKELEADSKLYSQ